MLKRCVFAIMSTALVLPFFATDFFVFEALSKPETTPNLLSDQYTSACIVNNGYAVLGSNHDSSYEDGMLYI